MTDNPHYVTPEEAKEKLCPQPDFTNCLGPKCMAWRWQALTEPSYQPTTLKMIEPVLSTTHGYCGKVRS